MSQADEILNSLTDEEISTYAVNSTIEEHIIIGNDRYITIPESLQRIAVQYDHNIETVTFDCPRYWDNNDLSNLHIYINYITPNNDKGRYLAKNVRIDTANPNLIHFDWTITKEITLYNGSLQFLICAVKTDSEANEELHWNSEINNQMHISNGLECADVVLQEYPDVINDIFIRLDTVIANDNEIVANTNEIIQNNEDMLNKREEILSKVDEGILDDLETKIAELETENTKLRDDINSLPSIAAIGETITIEGASEARFKEFKMDGVSTQEITPDPDNPCEIESVSGDIDINVCNENFLNIPTEYEVTGYEDIPINLPAGTYTISVKSINTTDDADTFQYIMILDENDNGIAYPSLRSTVLSKTFTITKKASKIRIYSSNNWLNSENVTTVFSELMISIDNNNYELYQGNNTLFPLSEPLRSLAGDIRDSIESDGIHRKIGVITLDGSEKWAMNNDLETDNFIAAYYTLTDRKQKTYAICNKLISKQYVDILVDGLISVECLRYDNQAIYFIINKNRLASNTLDDFKVWLSENPIIVQYELAEEVIEPFTNEQQTAYNVITNELKSYKGITHIFSTNDISPIFDVEALKDQQTENENLQAQIDELKQLLNTT